MKFILAIALFAAFVAEGANNFQAASIANYSTNGGIVKVSLSRSGSFTASNIVDSTVAITTNVGGADVQINLFAARLPGTDLQVQLLTTNSWAGVSLGPTQGIYTILLDLTNKWAKVPMASTNWFGKANTNSVNVRFLGIPTR